ncbi:response regulator transcription factor [Propionivibrio limicola]|uniref:response regulator transcription factor n=1 Tax=Propionivibrio limicola TaxID=167645 RepID=UPI0012922A0D|nr:response regulator [Propionivibrio limicola]
MKNDHSERGTPKVFLIDDDPVVTFLLVDLAESINLPCVVYESALKFVEQDLDGLQGCIVSDLRMPGMSGLELQDELNRRNVNLPIIFISAYAEVQSVVRAMRGGALDFFQKPFSSQELIERIQDGLRINKERAELLLRNRAIGERIAQLTPREKEVLQGIFDGKITKVIADELGIGVRTTETYRQLIMQKLQAGSVAELVRLVVDVMPLRAPVG